MTNERNDAHLIAAAPDLLAALRALVQAWDATTFVLPLRVELALNDADLAIAKAEGRTHADHR